MNQRLFSSVTLSLCVALGVFSAGCDTVVALDDAPLDDSAKRSDDQRPDRQAPFASPEADDEGSAQVGVPPAPVVAMAHDVSLWVTPIEGPELTDFAAIGGTFLTSTQLNRGWRLDRWDRATKEAAPSLAASHVEDSGDAFAPLLLTTDDPNEPGMILWIDAGTLLIRPLAAITAEAPPPGGRTTLFAPGDPTAAFFATETNSLESTPVATPVRDDHAGPESFFVCARENTQGVICTFMGATGEVDGWQTIGKLKSYEPIAIAPSGAGYIVLVARCSDDSCSNKQIISLRLDAAGKLPNRHGIRTIGTIQGRKGPIIARTAQGLVLVARRARAQDATAWHITSSSASELNGTFSRIQGATYLEGADGEHGETWFLEESPLLMRGGFPVGLLRPLRWSPAVGREDPLAWPRAIFDRLPGQPGQRVMARGGVVAILPAQRDARMDATFLQLLSNGDAKSPPSPSRKDRRRGRRR